MVSIEEELALAKQAKAAIEGKLTTEAIEVPRKAYRIAVLHLSNENPLNEARRNAGIALSTLIHSQLTPEKIDKAKSAVEEWIKQLRTT